MVAPKRTPNKRPAGPKMPPATSPQARENQLIGLAYNLVEQRLLDGTASAQETTHLLKMGSIRNQVELEKVRKESMLLDARVENLESSAHSDLEYSEVLKALKIYQGRGSEDD